MINYDIRYMLLYMYYTMYQHHINILYYMMFATYYMSLNFLVDVSENQHPLNGKICPCWIAFVERSTNKCAYFPNSSQ